jgi:hypothetical protein
MTDALSTQNKPLSRPPVSGPGSDKEAWRAFAAQETGRSIEGDLEHIKDRHELIAIVDQAVEKPEVRKAPEGVDVLGAVEDDEGRERAPRAEGPGGPQWVVPVEGGYVPEDELIRAERQRERDEVARRHEQAVEQLKQRG